jgi:hypothetical protein
MSDATAGCLTAVLRILVRYQVGWFVLWMLNGHPWLLSGWNAWNLALLVCTGLDMLSGIVKGLYDVQVAVRKTVDDRTSAAAFLGRFR